MGVIYKAEDVKTPTPLALLFTRGLRSLVMPERRLSSRIEERLSISWDFAMPDAIDNSTKAGSSAHNVLRTLKTSEGEVRISGHHSDTSLRLEISLPGSGSPNRCETTFRLEVIEYLVERIGCAGLAKFVNRFEDKGVPRVLRSQLLSYFRPEEFKGKRLLDFGCGCGASTFGMAKLLPETEILGVELLPERVKTAQRIAALQGISNIRFLCSPSGDQLPEKIGQFDFVMLSAVYEHLLPRERQIIMPLLWSAMKEGAAIFINQTPYRYFPFEHHSTGLWFINYMPDKLAHFVARKWSRHDPSKHNPAIQKSLNWETQLRGGIRGATEWEIIRNLTRGKKVEAQILQPRPECACDRADHWFVRTGEHRFQILKKVAAYTFRITDRLLGTVPSTNVEVVICKQRRLHKH
jgi:2-polyprenyl-3-methyl-5-hydroxy-6-metoxy-1,4-benzoquinol methylase